MQLQPATTNHESLHLNPIARAHEGYSAMENSSLSAEALRHELVVMRPRESSIAPGPVVQPAAQLAQRYAAAAAAHRSTTVKSAISAWRHETALVSARRKCASVVAPRMQIALSALAWCTAASDVRRTRRRDATLVAWHSLRRALRHVRSWRDAAHAVRERQQALRAAHTMVRTSVIQQMASRYVAAWRWLITWRKADAALWTLRAERRLRTVVGDWRRDAAAERDNRFLCDAAVAVVPRRALCRTLTLWVTLARRTRATRAFAVLVRQRMQLYRARNWVLSWRRGSAARRYFRIRRLQSAITRWRHDAEARRATRYIGAVVGALTPHCDERRALRAWQFVAHECARDADDDHDVAAYQQQRELERAVAGWRRVTAEASGIRVLVMRRHALRRAFRSWRACVRRQQSLDGRQHEALPLPYSGPHALAGGRASMITLHNSHDDVTTAVVLHSRSVQLAAGAGNGDPSAVTTVVPASTVQMLHHYAPENPFQRVLRRLEDTIRRAPSSIACVLPPPVMKRSLEPVAKLGVISAPAANATPLLDVLLRLRALSHDRARVAVRTHVDGDKSTTLASADSAAAADALFDAQLAAAIAALS